MDKPIVFTDFHHAGLLNSLILLFEGRMHGAVYRPIGIDWSNQGYWAIYDHPATKAQYLTLDQGYKPEDGTPPLNQFLEGVPHPEKNIYYCQDIDSGYFNKAITLDEFYDRHIDVVIASVPQHIVPFQRLCDSHPSKPKLIFQIGNAWDVSAESCKNVMASALVPNVPSGINFVSYHQEFDLNIFKFIPEFVPSAGIFSFVNVFQNFPDWKLFLEVESQMKNDGWVFRSFGGQCRDGAAHGSRQVAQKMRESQFIWHTKAGGDGYGHVLFSSAAVGRPLITKKSYYAGKLGEKLMIDGVTCIDIDNLSVSEIINKIRYYSEFDRWDKMCLNVYANFKQQVDFDKDEQLIRTFLDSLL